MIFDAVQGDEITAGLVAMLLWGGGSSKASRVNAFLYLSENGKPKNPNYVQDNDLLNSGHPKYSADKK
jgi:hypothetical protein